MQVIKWILIVLLALIIVVVAAGQLGMLAGRAPQDLGVKEGRLKRPSYNPNSVHSQADLWPDHPQREYARIAPLPARGDARATIAWLRDAVQALPGAQVVEARDDYLYVRFTTRLLRFVDDAEFWFDPAAGVVHLRSASRLGRKDFGVNRARIEALRARMAG